MAHVSTKGRIGQLLGDAALGLVLFAVMLSIGNICSYARAETVPARDAAVYAAAAPGGNANGMFIDLVSVSPQMSSLRRPAAFHKTEEVLLGTLALVFATLFALNLGFWRHLRSAYKTDYQAAEHDL